jgi:hypothetical protein
LLNLGKGNDQSLIRKLLWEQCYVGK